MHTLIHNLDRPFTALDFFCIVLGAVVGSFILQLICMMIVSVYDCLDNLWWERYRKKHPINIGPRCVYSGFTPRGENETGSEGKTEVHSTFPD